MRLSNINIERPEPGVFDDVQKCTENETPDNAISILNPVAKIFIKIWAWLELRKLKKDLKNG